MKIDLKILLSRSDSIELTALRLLQLAKMVQFFKIDNRFQKGIVVRKN